MPQAKARPNHRATGEIASNLDPTSKLLSSLGKTAGIGGIAVGVFFILFRDVIRKNIFPSLEPTQAYNLLLLVLLLTFAISVAGLAVWASKGGTSKVTLLLLLLFALAIALLGSFVIWSQGHSSASQTGADVQRPSGDTVNRLNYPWHSDFRNPNKELILKNWDEPLGRSISTDGKLIVTTTRPVMFIGDPSSEIDNFTLDFIVNLHKGQKNVSWVIRADKAKKNYYNFTLEFKSQTATEEPAAVVTGVEVRKGLEAEELSVKNPSLPFAALFEGEQLDVHLKAEENHFDYDFWILPPTVEQIAKLDGATLSVILDQRLGLAGRCYRKIFTASKPYYKSGRFGFFTSAPESPLRIEKIDLNDPDAEAGAKQMCESEHAGGPSNL